MCNFQYSVLKCISLIEKCVKCSHRYYTYVYVEWGGHNANSLDGISGPVGDNSI